VAALVHAWGGDALRLTPTSDDKAAIAQALRAAACDLVVTIGGASVGDYDLVKPALAELGLVMKVESLKMRPGKPTWFGTLADGRKVLGLPGNPASALACAQLFLKPLVRALLGADPDPRMAKARLARPLAANGPREHWMRAKLDYDGPTLVADPMGDQDSSLVTVFADADALLRRPGEAAAAAAGDVADVLPLERLA
jgi:molybdopterin molybdotransferase